MATVTANQKAARREIEKACIGAAWEIEELARALPRLLPDSDPWLNASALCIARRIAELAGVVSAGLGDQTVKHIKEMDVIVPTGAASSA